MNILFVEDDEKYQSIIKELLVVEGYSVDTVTSAADGIRLLKENTYQLIITDYDMEDVDGLQFIHLAKKIKEHIKIIVLTGVFDPEVELRSLELEVDEFIQKPVDFSVLVKRIEIVINKKEKISKKILISESADIVVDLQRRIVTQYNKRVDLTVTEYNLLVFFLRNKNEVQSRQDIFKHVWRDNKGIDFRAVDTHIKNLRSKLDISCIYSIRGIGYEWVEEK